MGACFSTDVTEFSKYNYENCPKLFDKEFSTIARVVDIYDGDTCTCIFKLNNTYYKFNIRLNGIDTCEMKSKINEVKDKALLARNRLFNLITKKKLDKLDISRKDTKVLLNKDVYLVKLTIYGLEKYGRVLADIYDLDNTITSFSSILINEKLGYKYDGKTKLSEEMQIII